MVLPYAQCCWWELGHDCSAEAITTGVEEEKGNVRQWFYCNVHLDQYVILILSTAAGKQILLHDPVKNF